jgi:hypothetical protein
VKVNISREGTYIPKWEDNRDLPEDEQIVVSFVSLTHDERQKYTHKEKPTYSIETEGKTDEEIEAQLEAQTRRAEFKAWTDDDKIAVACKPTIKNLEDTEGNPIDTWAKLLAAPQTAENQIRNLVVEIEAHLGSLAKETDTKN